VIALMRCRGRGRALPDDAAAVAIDRDDLEAMLEPRVRATARPTRSGRCPTVAGRPRGGEIQPPAGDDRRLRGGRLGANRGLVLDRAPTIVTVT
jgi:hypothetical protein